jgi:hypothetical protein
MFQCWVSDPTNYLGAKTRLFQSHSRLSLQSSLVTQAYNAKFFLTAILSSHYLSSLPWYRPVFLAWPIEIQAFTFWAGTYMIQT